MKQVVLDASVATKLFLPVPGHDLAWRAAERYAFCAPSLLLTETAYALWKYVRRGDTSAADAKGAVSRLSTIVELHGGPDLVEAALLRACALGHPVYDCTYLALAEQFSLPLLSADNRLLALAADGLPLDTLAEDDPAS